MSNSKLESQVLLRNNFDIIDSLSKLSSENICKELVQKGIKKASLKFQDHSAMRLIKQRMLESAVSNNLELLVKDEPDLPVIDIMILKAETEFNLIDDNNEQLIRIINLGISGNISYVDGKVSIITSVDHEYRDIIKRNDLEIYQNVNYSFANGKVPEAPMTFFEEIAEPLIVVGSAILVVVLLFTVRSG